MPNSDQLINNGQASPEDNFLSNPPEHSLNNAPNLERLIPKNLSHNKRAVIERLIVLHLSQTT
ncbi:hypothetical protein C7B65_12445 [Phormidesmis priestleyi ULC007]|uniref:Uncharacterized protein n=1 Tax=Phormidesmis priestleyi ULC007 TaxID=1920490 RepID=A0A2T1DF13_9CYAN|nr:hypothetical protein C7B65_12445 [Phormidesmis priestleyi ULC007]PZO46051.1 MAG: hypothetical protein DCF14_23805 [Phormidesmis priestleyi]